MSNTNDTLIAFSEEPNPSTFQKILDSSYFYWGSDDWPYPIGTMKMALTQSSLCSTLTALEEWRHDQQ